MKLPAWAEIEAATDYDTLAEMFWRPVPAFDSDSRARVRRMAERMAELRPRVQREYIAATVQPKHSEPVSSPPPQTPAAEATPCKPKPKKPIRQAAQPADMALFKSLFGR